MVSCDLGGLGFPGNNGMNASAMVPWPAGATPDPQSDHHLLIIDRSTMTEWGMWNVVDNGGQWHCGLGATMDLSGSGVRPLAEGNPTWYTSHGPRAGRAQAQDRPERLPRDQARPTVRQRQRRLSGGGGARRQRRRRHAAACRVGCGDAAGRDAGLQHFRVAAAWRR